MSQADPDEARAREEASAWLAKLNRRQVSLSELETFRAWRAYPANRRAYETVERLWRGADALKGEAGIERALGEALARGEARKRRGERRGAWIAGAVVASIAGLLVAGAAWLYEEGHPSFTTRIGEQRLLRLADGSAVRLDTDSRIEVAYSGQARRIRLERGQAFFEVAHDPGRPFVVRAGAVSVRAIGTKFDVKADHGAPTVTLVEGVVEVRRAGAAPQVWMLRAGEQVATGPAATPRAVNLETATSWTVGRVVFQGAPLVEAVAEINRYCAHKIILNAPGIADTPVTGSFETGDAEAFASAVSDLHGLQIDRRPDGEILLDAPAAPSH